MSTYRHDWTGVEPDDGGTYICRKCKRIEEGQCPTAHDCPVSNAEFNAVAWLGQAGLFRTRLEAVQNGEQLVEPVSAKELLQHARRYVHLTRHLGMGFKRPHACVTKTPEATDAAIDQHMSTMERTRHA
ncbi:hypothetical protein D3C81_1387220 [compost metagenome]